METALQLLTAISTIETLILLISLGYGFYLWLTGILPVLLRIGNGLSKRKVAILAKGDNANSLRTLLTDSKLFKNSNIIPITKTEDLGCLEDASVYLMHWHDFADDIEQILSKKPNECPMIVYAPYNMERIPNEQMENLDGKRHTAVTNFRGRLLNDIVTAMITTSYER